MSDVFISYSRRNTAFVTPLQRALEAAGKSVWVDVEGIRAGEVFPEVLRTAIEEADAFVVVLTPDAAASPYCAQELAHAEAMEKRIVPLLVSQPEADGLPAGLRERHWIRADTPERFDPAMAELTTALDTDLAHVRRHTRLLVRAREWDAAGRDRGLLPRGQELADAEAWLADAGGAKEPAPTELHRAFIDAGRAAATRRLRSITGASAAVAVVSLALLVFALISRHDAVTQRRHAQSVALTAVAGRLGVESSTDARVDSTMLLARQAVALEDSVTTRGDLLGALVRNPAAIGMIKGAGNKHQQMALSPDGKTLVLAGGSGTLVALDPIRRRRIAVSKRVTRVRFDVATLAYAPDGRTIAVGGQDGTVALLDGRTLETSRVLDDLRPHGILSLTFSHDGRRLAATCGCFDAARTRVWDMRTGRLLSRRKIPGASSGLFFTLDDRQLILPLDHSTRFLDPRSLRTVRTIPGPTWNAALSPDGRTLAAGQKDGSIRFVNLRTGRSRTAVGRHDGSIFSMVFSRDGTHIVTTGADDVALDWNVRSATVVNTLNGFSGCNCGAAISPDGRTLYTDGFNGDVVIWDLDGARRFVRPFLTGAGVPQIPSGAIAPSGHLLAQVSPDGITLFDTRTLQTRARVALPRRGPHPTGAVAFSADGRRVLADVGRGSIAEYRTADGRPAGKPFRTVGPVPIDLAYTRDGSGILELTEGGQVLRIDRPGARPHKLARVPGAGALAVSPRGDVVAVATADGFVVLLDARTGHRQHRFRADPESLSTLAYSHDGRRLVTSGQLGARIFTATGRPLGPTLPGELDAIIDARFSTDDRLVATGSYAGTVRLYDAASGRELASGIKPVGSFVRVFFTPDGRELLGLYDTGDGFRMPVTFGAWARTACRIAGRSLTRAEWQRDVPGQPFAPACT